jgi:hypothetical protein
MNARAEVLYANDRRKDFMYNYNKSGLHLPGIEPVLSDSQSNSLTILS